jgi:putative tryptophan/tyrosine transport system substrate-binding protein
MSMLFSQHTRRREFLACAAATVLGCSARALAQQRRTPRVGRLSPLSREADIPMIEALLAGLKERGWIEGHNFTLETRFADGDGDRLSSLAAELVVLKVDVIVTGSNPGALAAKDVTSQIPIVFVTTGDPISGHLVTSLHRPEANLTGVTALGVELTAKRLELLKESFGGGSIAVLTHPGSPYTEEFVDHRTDLQRALSIEVEPITVTGPADLPSRINGLSREHFASLLVLSDIMFITNRQVIVDSVASRRLPAMYPDRSFIDAGGLMFYGAPLPSMYRHAASYVDKILRGAKPSDLPVEQPTSFELVINLKTGKTLGLTIPPTLLARADEVIE